ncbi:FOG: Zn-finger [Ceraceosorus bombacis]|uniref:FOG: Zn-finger n=1 Tax=Ceraceosorus bombacis TaxID=401625 RepID=A0A0P1BJ88_9BASI|nr:FOG: Zn-finger [Ceraceosorus bombacis]
MSDDAAMPPPPPPANLATNDADTAQDQQEVGHAGSPAGSSILPKRENGAGPRESSGNGRAPSKKQKRGSVSGGAASCTNGKDNKADASTGDGSAPAGPPYICPTCSTSYSRLEYLRRHERRHADERPFVCDCGKGFSRSDVLSRHKRQCPVALGHAPPEDPATAGTSKQTKPRRSNKKAAANTTSASSVEAPAKRESDDQQPPGLTQEMSIAAHYDADASAAAGAAAIAAAAAAAHAALGGPQPNSFPFSGPSQQPSLLPPPVPYGAEQIYEPRGYPSGAVSEVGGPLHSQVSALNPSHSQLYPQSPDSNHGGLGSQMSSPRFASRDMIRHGSGSGSRFGLRKPSASLDVFGRSTNSANAYSGDFWDAIEAASKGEGRSSRSNTPSRTRTLPPSSLPNSNSTSMHASGAFPFSMPGNEFAQAPQSASAMSVGSRAPAPNLATLGIDGGPPPPAPAPGIKEGQRFGVNGPLSPFGSIALSSGMSPYLSAFSNARDTPHMSSPSRGGPGTPGGSANIFEWTMRPPAKPSSSRRDSSSTPSGNAKRKREDGETEDPRAASSNLSGAASVDESSLEADAAQLLETLRTLRSGGAASTTSTNNDDADAQRKAPGPSGAITHTSAGGVPTIAEPPVAPSSSGVSHDSALPHAPHESETRSYGPEAFLLRLQGGAQEARAGLLGPDSAYSRGMLGTPMASTAGATHPSAVVTQSPGTQSLWESLGLNAVSSTPMSASASAGGSNLGWLMSPSIQQLISTFAGTPTPGDGGSYFSGANIEPSSHEYEDPPIESIEPWPENAGERKKDAEASAVQRTDSQQAAARRANPTTMALERVFADISNPFYIPPDLFRACYAITHWQLPSLTRLSMLALHSQQNLLKHFPIVHEPTFRLDTTPGCLAFTLSMLGCHEAGRRWWAGEEVVQRVGKPWLSAQNADAWQSQGKPLVDEEDGQELVKAVVMREKTDMLARNFAARAKTEKDRVSVVQSLMLYHANNFLSPDLSVRCSGAQSHDAVVSLARDAGLFDPEASHAKREVRYSGDDVVRTTLGEASDLAFSYSFLPTYLPSCTDEEKVWRRWSELAGRRRTAFLLLVLDTVASLDTSQSFALKLEELGHLPLPSPDTLWRAPNADAWRRALNAYRGPTFDESMFDILSGDGEEGVSPGKTHPSVFGPHGPFARLVIVSTLLRGVLHLLEGRTLKVSTPSPLERWMQGTERKTVLTGGRGGMDAQVEIFKRALARWRKAWDMDDLCLCASGPAGRAKAGHAPDARRPFGENVIFTAQTASGATPLCDDALPFYWLAHVLLGHVSSPTTALPRRSPSPSLADQNHRGNPAEGLDADDSGGQPSKGSPDFRSMLRFAKAFVQQGEGASTTSSETEAEQAIRSAA